MQSHRPDPDVVAALLTAVVGAAALAGVAALNPPPTFAVGVALGMALSIALGFLFRTIRDRLEQPSTAGRHIGGR